MTKKSKIHRSKNGGWEYWYIRPHGGFGGRWHAQRLDDGTMWSFATLPELLNWITQ